MPDFYCIGCNEVKRKAEADRIFSSGFHRVGNYDIPMGLCKDCSDEESSMVNRHD